MSEDTEAARVRQAYARRAALGLDERYAYWTPANLYLYQSRERALVALLRRARLLPLAGRRVLDVGCGEGGVLLDLLRLGARPADLCGVDLLEERVALARERLPGARIDVADARSLPYGDESFDLVLGFTLLSSVGEGEPRRRVSAEMVRVLRPGGLVILYDFWLNPLNRDARPLRRDEVRRLFPGREVKFRSVTLAPPLARVLAPLPGGWLACSALEMLPFLRTHFLAAVRGRS